MTLLELVVLKKLSLTCPFSRQTSRMSSREGGERAGVEERAGVSVENVDALSSGEAVPVEAVEGDVVGRPSLKVSPTVKLEA